MIQAQVRDTIKSKQLIKRGDRVMVCVSGGPDSMALMHLMLELRQGYGIKLAVAHLDHMIRGKQSAADANFVKKTTAALNIPFILEKHNVKKMAKSRKMSTEEAAREARYDFFQRAAKKSGANKIATAHTLDDQAETVLMRFIKGSGSLGLSGIPYKRRLGRMWVIRPLLNVRRTEIERYLKKHRIPSRVDSTNLEILYLRNKIRHLLLPLLEKEFNPKIKENLVLVAKSLGDEFNYINTAALRLFKKLASRTSDGIKINIRDLSRRHIALQRLIVRQIINTLKGDLKRISFKHWQEIEAMFADEKKTCVDLPAGLKVTKKQGHLIFTKSGMTQRPKTLKKIVRLDIPGGVVLPELGVTVQAEIAVRAPKFKKGKKRRRCEYIDGNSISSPLKIRTRRKGDRMKPLGMSSYKKLHDIFVDAKVPRQVRDRIPLIVSGNKILWAAGVKLSEDCKINKDTQKVIKLAINRLF